MKSVDSRPAETSAGHRSWPDEVLPAQNRPHPDGVAIYTLSNRRTGEVRYVGKSTDPARRMYQHLTGEGQSHCHRWVAREVAAGYPPVMQILEWVANDQWEQAECIWIRQIRAMGARLTNITDGGQAGWSSEARSKALVALRGKKQSPETRAKRSIAMKGRSIKWGERIGTAVLTDALVRELRIYRRAGGSLTEWAAAHGVTKTAAWGAANGKSWIHHDEPPVPSRPRQRVTDQQVAQIRLDASQGYSHGSIAEKYGISRQHVTDIASGKKRSARPEMLTVCIQEGDSQ